MKIHHETKFFTFAHGNAPNIPENIQKERKNPILSKSKIPKIENHPITIDLGPRMHFEVRGEYCNCAKMWKWSREKWRTSRTMHKKVRILTHADVKVFSISLKNVLVTDKKNV